MKQQMLNSPSRNKSLLTFFVLVFVTSSPFWLLGAVAEQLLPPDRPIDLPILFPNLGSHYDPVMAGIITMVTATIVIFFWGPATLARYRYARLGQDVQPSAAH